MAQDSMTGLPVRLHDEDFIPYSENNPLPVSLEESEGDEIVDFLESEDVVKNGGTATHEYTVSSGKVFQLEQVLYSGSGRAKFEIGIETAAASGIFTPIATGFVSTSRLEGERVFKRALKVAGGVKVRVLMTNLDNQDYDLHTTIIGLEK